MLMPATVVSAPGKVLFAGGYIVLDPRYPGLIVGSASRFYTAVEDLNHEDGHLDRKADSVCITVNSPQFTDLAWKYAINYADAKCEVSQVENGCVRHILSVFIFLISNSYLISASRNPFVQYALEAALKISFALGRKVQHGLRVDIVGDNDFYSQKRPVSRYSKANHQKVEADLLMQG
jgi:phosphomevalonate kinase